MAEIIAIIYWVHYSVTKKQGLHTVISCTRDHNPMRSILLLPHFADENVFLKLGEFCSSQIINKQQR